MPEDGALTKAPTRKKIFDLRGESRQTRAGVQRQTVLLAAEPGEPITLLREPTNSFDPNAVLACVAHHDLGYLSKDDAAVIAPALDEGVPYEARIHELTGGFGQYKHVGARISIAWCGQKLPAYKERDDRQENARDKKVRAMQQTRGSGGRFEGGASSGCFGIIVAVIAVGVTALAVSEIV